MHFVDTNTVILKKQQYPLKCVRMYRKNNPNGEFFSHFLQVAKRSTNGRGYPEL